MPRTTKQENQPMTQKMKMRLNRILVALILLLLVYVGGKLISESVINADFYRDKASTQQFSTKVIGANRGTIYDSNGEILAQSATVSTVVAAPSLVTQDKLYLDISAIPVGTSDLLVQNLATLLNLSEGSVKTLQEKIVAKENRFALVKKFDLKKSADKDAIEAVKAFILAGNASVMLAKEMVATALSDILHLDYNRVLTRLYKNNQYEIIKKKTETLEADELRSFISTYKYTQITLLDDTKRYYPNNELLSNVIGFTGSDNQGVYGIEYQYDSVLRGTNGKLLTATDGLGNPIPTNFEQKYDAMDGDSIVTTFDKNIQRFAENALNDLVNLHKPEGGATAIVMDINTGAILAMASSNNYDPNRPSEIYPEAFRTQLDTFVQTQPQPSQTPATSSSDASSTSTLSDTSADTSSQPQQTATQPAPKTEKEKLEETLRAKQWRNDPVNKLYEPGSVYKAVTAAAALESGHSTLHDSFYCPGFIEVGGEIMRCNERDGHGTLTFSQAIVKSCNPSFVQIGLDMGAQTFTDFFREFGLQEATGIDLPGEAKKSIYVPFEKMGLVELASSSFGQTTAITPLQMITAMAAVANGGYLVQPYVLKQVLDPNGNTIKTNQPTYRRQVISQETSETLRPILEAMVEQSGTAFIKGYRIGGKSGTSQKGNNSNNGRYSSFAGFAPADNPQVVTLVIADQVTVGSYYGSSVCGPAVGSILSETLGYLGVARQYTEEELQKINVAVPMLIGDDLQTAEKILKGANLQAQIQGSGDRVVNQMPRGASISQGSKVILYTDPDSALLMGNVPNVIGMSPDKANKELTNAGFCVSPDGNISQIGKLTVIYQSHGVGEELPKGTPVVIKYGTEVRDD